MQVAHDAVVLQNPGVSDVEFGLYADHQSVAADEICGTVFGGSAETCREVLAVIMPVFAAAPPAPPDLSAVCRRYSVRAILVKDTDPVWGDPQSWMWKRNPEYENSFSRVFACPN